jgi:dTMP kinase
VAKLIKPALADGKWVLCDRFLDSSVAYQGGAAHLGFDAIRALHRFGSKGFLPDRTLFLSLAARDAARRAYRRDSDRPDRFGRRGMDYHREVFLAFQAIAEEEPDRFRIVDASGAPEDVTSRLLAAIEDLL